MKLFYIVTLSLLLIGGSLFLFHAMRRSPGLLKPTGPYGIGTTTYHLIDNTRKEPHTKNTDAPRELMVQVWYPSDMHNLQKTPYIPSQNFLEIIKADLKKVFNATDKQLISLESLKTHAQSHAPISLKRPAYPVIIFSPGSGAPVIIYSTLIEELASNGYIVVGINYPFISSAVEFPQERLVQNIQMADLQKMWSMKTETEVTTKEQEIWVADIQFVLDTLKDINENDPQNIFTDRLDLKHIGLAGHSFGGGASINLCALDKRCKAVVNIDGRFTYSSDFDHAFNTPALFIRNPFHKQEKKDQLQQQIKNMFGPTEYYEIPNMLHQSFTDLPLFIVEKDNEKRTINPRNGLQITRKHLLTFFYKYLK